MKKINLKTLSITLITIFGLSTLVTSCKKDDGNGNGNQTNIGKYAGIMVGSSGYYIIYFTEGNANATIQFDGNTYYLTSALQIEQGNDYADVLFSTADGQVSLRFSVNADGSNPSVTFDIPGHDVVASIDQFLEENSLALYEGTGHTESGNNYIVYTYNVALNHNGNTFTIISRVRDSNTLPVGETEVINGTFQISGSNITFNYPGGSLNGIITGNTIKINQSGFIADFSLAYQGDNNSGTQDDIIGKWKRYSSTDNGATEFHTHECEAEHGVDYLELKANNTLYNQIYSKEGENCFFNGDASGTWQKSGNSLTLHLSGEAPFTAQIVELNSTTLEITSSYTDEENGNEHQYSEKFVRIN